MINWTNNDNKIKILGSCEWFWIFARDQPVTGLSWLNGRRFPYKPHILLQKYQYNKILTLWTLKWWESETKNDNRIKILGSCEWF